MAKQYGEPSEEAAQSHDFFGLLKLVQAREMEANSTTGAHPFEEFLHSKGDQAGQEEHQTWPEVRSLNDDGAQTVAEAVVEGDVRSQTIYPEPVLSKEQVKSGGFVLYIAGKCALDCYLMASR